METIPDLWARIHKAHPKHTADTIRLIESVVAYERARGTDTGGLDLLLLLVRYGQRLHSQGRPVPQDDGSVRFDMAPLREAAP